MPALFNDMYSCCEISLWGDATINGKLLIAKGVTTDFDCEKITASYNNYIQDNIQNTSNGNSASSDHVATADTGNETTNFIDM